MIAIPERTEELARRLAAKTGVTPLDVIHRALEERAKLEGMALEGPRSEKSVQEKIDAMAAVARECSTLPILDPRGADDIIGYDATGLPR